LGSRPKQGLARLQAKRGSLGVKESVKEWTFTCPRELPPWELESQWTPKCLEIIERLSLSIFAFAHCHAAHSTILSIIPFHSNTHVVILSKCLNGFSLVLSLGYSNNFFA
jgi:hypothetical protein